MLREGQSYDYDQYERLTGQQPALVSIFKLKALANKLRHRTGGFEFRRDAKPVEDLLSGQDTQALGQGLSSGSKGDAGSRGFNREISGGGGTSVVVHGPDNSLGLYTIMVHPMCSLLVCVPLGIASAQLGWGDSWTFWLNFLALVPLAKILGDATEELAASLHNDTISGLLNASFGNAVEMIVSVQALRSGLLSVVKLSLLGSVLSNILLVLGSSFFLGGLTPSSTRRGRFHSFQGSSTDMIGMEKEQKFPVKSALISMAMLLFSCMSFALPTIFDAFTTDDARVLTVSRMGAWILASAYCAFLIFQLLTHSKTIAQEESTLALPVEADPGHMRSGSFNFEAEGLLEDEEDESASISAWCAIGLMMVCTIVTSVSSELLVNVIESVVKSAHIPKSFIGVILLPIAGNACEHAGAIRFAMNDRPGLAIGIAVGSSTQVALLVVPFAVIMGSFLDKPLNLNFGLLNTAVVTLSVLVVLTLLLDGRSNWMKGYLLMALYLFIAILYWYTPSSLS